MLARSYSYVAIPGSGQGVQKATELLPMTRTCSDYAMRWR